MAQVALSSIPSTGKKKVKFVNYTRVNQTQNLSSETPFLEGEIKR
jgi:hypothetical protein